VIDLFTAPTPNGYKVSVALEEMALPYEVHALNLLEGDQHAEWFRRINPNGKIPAIVDREADDFAVFESGAILVYLAEKTGRLMPAHAKARSITLQWLMFQMGGLGPMMGQANVFYRYFPEKIPPVIDRYHNEVRRLFGVLDAHLDGRDYLVDELTIADVACWSWARAYEWAGVEIEPYPRLAAWIDRLAGRPAFERGTRVPLDIMALRRGERATRVAAEARGIVGGASSSSKENEK